MTGNLPKSGSGGDSQFSDLVPCTLSVVSAKFYVSSHDGDGCWFKVEPEVTIPFRDLAGAAAGAATTSQAFWGRIPFLITFVVSLYCPTQRLELHIQWVTNEFLHVFPRTLR